MKLPYPSICFKKTSLPVYLPVLILLQDLARIDSAIKALHKKFQPGAFIEMN